MHVPCLVYIYRWFVGVLGICVHAAGAVFLSRDRSVSALALMDDGGADRPGMAGLGNEIGWNSRVDYTFESGQTWSYSAVGSKSWRPM
jgi:hypothetical protein